MRTILYIKKCYLYLENIPFSFYEINTIQSILNSNKSFIYYIKTNGINDSLKYHKLMNIIVSIAVIMNHNYNLLSANIV